MKILFVTPEMYPINKTNEVADFSYYLPKYLINQGAEVRIVTPKYKNSNIKKIETIGDFGIQMAYKKEACILKSTNVDDMLVYLIENYQYFDRDFMYAYDDDCERFAFFSRAVLEMLKYIDFKPDVIHINDWQSAPVSMIINENYRKDSFYKDIAVVYTIHSLSNQGICSKGFLKLLGTDENVFNIEKTEYYNMINYMKMGMVYSDLITTLSKTYAEEILTRDFGNGLDGVLNTRKKELCGIVNGIDYKEYNPKTDKIIAKNYSEKNYINKLENKYALQERLNLPQKDVPVIAFIAPLLEEKGIELLLESMDSICEKDVQVVIIGVGNAVYEYSLKFAMSKYMYQVHVLIGEDEELERQVFAASDIFLAPYRIAPYGQNEIIALRYGSVLVARKTGCLNDIVVDAEDENGYGYKFEKFTSKDMLASLDRALECYKEKDKWDQLVYRNLKLNFSWKKTATNYKKVYERAIKNRKEFVKKGNIDE